MNYSFPLRKLGWADRKAFYMLFAPPECPQHCRPLIPGGDRLSSRGQCPWKPRPQQGPTLKGSNPDGVPPVLRPAAEGNTTPPGSGNERGAFRGRCPRLLSCALAGHENLPLGLTPRLPVSDITDSHFRLCMLRTPQVDSKPHPRDAPERN
jgi:hypothetical protein